MQFKINQHVNMLNSEIHTALRDSDDLVRSSYNMQILASFMNLSYNQRNRADAKDRQKCADFRV